MEQIASLLGCGDSALYDYGTTSPRPGRRARVPFTMIFALRVMVAALPATAAALWGRHAG